MLAVHGSTVVRLGIMAVEKMLAMDLPCVLTPAASQVKRPIGALSPGVEVHHFHCRPLSLERYFGL
jgi:hypothetical protein